MLHVLSFDLGHSPMLSVIFALHHLLFRSFPALQLCAFQCQYNTNIHINSSILFRFSVMIFILSLLPQRYNFLFFSLHAVMFWQMCHFIAYYVKYYILIWHDPLDNLWSLRLCQINPKIYQFKLRLKILTRFLFRIGLWPRISYPKNLSWEYKTQWNKLKILIKNFEDSSW